MRWGKHGTHAGVRNANGVPTKFLLPASCNAQSAGDIPGVHIYTDVLLTSSKEQHMELLPTVLGRLRDAGLKVAPDKCRLFQTRLTYLGHEITPDGVQIDPARTKVVADMEPPKTLKEAKRIFGFFSWFRKFIPSFSDMAEPLIVLCNADKFYWNAELVECFANLRNAMLSDTVLSYPRREGQFILYTDSSITGSGQVLSQIQDGIERVIAYGGSRYSKAQRRWTIYELEVFSFVQGLKKFYRYLADAEFRWICDCKSALRILDNRDHINPRLIRWRVFVSQFCYVPEHRSASLMAHVDTLSRLHESESVDPNVTSDVMCVTPSARYSRARSLPRLHESAGAVPNVTGDVMCVTPSERVLAPTASELGASVTSTVTCDVTHVAPRVLAAASPAVPGDGGGRGRGRGAVTDAPDRPVGPSPPGSEPIQRCDPPVGRDEGDASVADDQREVREVNLTAADFLVQSPLKPDALLWYQKHDRNCRAIAHRLNHGKWPRFAPPHLKREPAENFRLRDGLVYRGDQIVWPVAKRFEVMYRHHDVSHHAHGGAAKLHEMLSRHVWYPGLLLDCRAYLSSCDRCSQKKDTRSHVPPLLPQAATHPNEILVIDVVSMPRGQIHGRTSVLTCIDKFSGYLSYYPLDATSSEHIVEALSQHFLVFGPLECVESDAGSNLLKNPHVQTLCEHFGTRTRVSVGYHHEAVGKLERRHLDIKRRLRAVSDTHGADWEQRLQGIIYSLNNEVCEALGYSPFFLYYLRHPNSSLSSLAEKPKNQYSDQYVHEKLRLLAATLRQAQDNQERTALRYKRQYDRRHQVRDMRYRPGDRFWMRNFDARSKMDNPWLGPYVVVTKVGRRHIEYADGRGRVRRTHVKNTKPWNDRAV